MKASFCILLLFYILLHLGACLNTTNSYMSDAETYGSPTNEISNPLLQAARPILLEKCASCHTGKHQDYTSSLSIENSWWVSQGLIVEGHPETSLLFQRLKGANLGGAAENMPQVGSLSAQELETIRLWIAGTAAGL